MSSSYLYGHRALSLCTDVDADKTLMLIKCKKSKDGASGLNYPYKHVSCHDLYSVQLNP